VMDQSTAMIETRAMLLRSIEQNPGIRQRELLRRTGLVNRVLSYHISALEKSDVIKVDRQPRTTRYYPVTLSDKEYNILKFVRHKPVRHIMIFLLGRDLCTFNEIVDHLQKAHSTRVLTSATTRRGRYDTDKPRGIPTLQFDQQGYRLRDAG
jgi:predicted transcriptional regulator